jgi:predicted transcriptional regulator
VTREQTQQQLITHLADRAFGGSAMQLAQQALASAKASPQDLAEIRKMLDDFERSRS